MVTVHHTEQDIDLLLERIAYRLPMILEKENFTRAQIDKAFNLMPSIDGVSAIVSQN
jgi:hypothetical protein